MIGNSEHCWKETPMLTPFGYFDLIDEMEKSGCPVCNLLARDANKLLNTILYEYVIEPEMHGIFRASHGLCNEHGWQLVEMGNAMSIAVLYKAVVDEILKKMNSTISTGNSRGMRRLFGRAENHAMADALESEYPCPVCDKKNENEKRYIQVFRDHLSDERLITAYKPSDGLCLKHFQQVLNSTSNAEDSHRLIDMQRQIWMDLQHDLSEFVRKYDFNNADEAMGKEGNSWLRSISQMTGGKGIFGLRNMSKRNNKNSP
jgi:hypothetical protein